MREVFPCLPARWLKHYTVPYRLAVVNKLYSLDCENVLCFGEESTRLLFTRYAKARRISLNTVPFVRSLVMFQRGFRNMIIF